MKLIWLYSVFFHFFFTQNLEDFNFAKFLYQSNEYQLAQLPLYYQYNLNKNDSSYNYLLKTFDKLNEYDKAIDFIKKDNRSENNLFYFLTKTFQSDFELDTDKLSHINQKLYSSYKSPDIHTSHLPYTLASAILPGSGKMLDGNFSDGFTSLTINSLFAFLTIRSFNNSSGGEIAPYIYGTFFSYFYLSNIYGTYISIKIKNRDKITAFRKNLHLKIQYDF